MKNIIFILVTFFTISCKAQQIKDVFRDEEYQAGVYYKDLNNNLNPFVGIYTYTNGTKTFKMELRKMIHSSVNNIYFEDMIIGAYEYKDGNTIIASTFDNLNNGNFIDGNNFKLKASNIFIGDWPGCDVCTTNTHWMSGRIRATTYVGSNEIRFKKVVENGQEALRVLIMAGGVSSVPEGQPKPIQPPLNYPCCEEFVMIKQ
jgi:hypothetical protein